MRYYSLIFFYFILLSCKTQQSSPILEAYTPTVVSDSTQLRMLCLGDSYTKGESVAQSQSFPYLLKDSLEKYEVENDSIHIHKSIALSVIAQTGWTTQNLLNAIDNANPGTNYDIVTLLIGVNNQYQRKPIAQYEAELLKLIQKALSVANGDTSHVYMISIPDYAYTPFGQNSGNAAQISQEIDLYNAIAAEYAAQFHISYFYITDISREGLAKPTLVANDGLHPSGKMYQLWVDRMFKEIKERIDK